jgi:hypothetical protein
MRPAVGKGSDLVVRDGPQEEKKGRSGHWVEKGRRCSHAMASRQDHVYSYEMSRYAIREQGKN